MIYVSEGQMYCCCETYLIDYLYVKYIYICQHFVTAISSALVLFAFIYRGIVLCTSDGDLVSLHTSAELRMRDKVSEPQEPGCWVGYWL